MPSSPASTAINSIPDSSSAAPDAATASSEPSPSASATASASPSPAPSDSPSPVHVNWENYPVGSRWRDGSTHGAWLAERDGGGKTRVVPNAAMTNALQLDPKPVRGSADTQSALVLSSSNVDDVDATIEMQTIKQLRKGSSPHPWETGRILWHYTDEQHFYYFAPKTNGWELGKEDSSATGGRRVLAAGTSPAFPIGTLQKIRIVQNGSVITIYDNRLKITSVNDTKPYESGRFGLYSQDAEADFGSLAITTAAGTTTI